MCATVRVRIEESLKACNALLSFSYRAFSGEALLRVFFTSRYFVFLSFCCHFSSNFQWSKIKAKTGQISFRKSHKKLFTLTCFGWAESQQEPTSYCSLSPHHSLSVPLSICISHQPHTHTRAHTPFVLAQLHWQPQRQFTHPLSILFAIFMPFICAFIVGSSEVASSSPDLIHYPAPLLLCSSLALWHCCNAFDAGKSFLFIFVYCL